MKKLYLLLLLALLPGFLFAGNGKICGTVTDIETGETLFSVNIFLEGTSRGTQTDMNGAYCINNIAPGEYTLEASYIGYATVKIADILVTSDSTTTLNFSLSPETYTTETIELQDVVVSKQSLYYGPVREDHTPHNTEEYGRIVENTFFDALKSPLSTFAADVDAASYSNARRFLMMDQLPYRDAVRIEEFINYFDYDYKQPENGRPLSINMEYSDCPWNEEHKLIHIGLQGKELKKEEQKPGNLVFLIDVSGSMGEPQKLPLLKRSFRMLVEQLSHEDKVAIAVYAGSAGLVLPATPGSEKAAIINALEGLEAGGSTAGGEGIQLAYKIAEENFIEGGNNRVILATDGDFNVGISSTSELVRFVESKKDNGIFLTILGFGMGNYKDNRLQELADRGNGNHAYIDNILEAKKVLVNEITSTLFTIAKDVKIQVEFNPAKIKSYRLLGYENRLLEDKDFEDDKKDAGEIGAGHTVTALYEAVLADENGPGIKHELKYQETKLKKEARESDEILNVKIRYKEPDGSESKEFSEVLKDNPLKLAETSDNFRFSAAVAEFAMLLNDSQFKGTSDTKTVTELAKSSKGADMFGYRAEFLNLVYRAETLMNDN